VKSVALGKLRRDLLAKGIVTALPTCPTCGQMVTPKQWDSHQAGHKTKTRDG
jgi:hypothetical protein